MLGAPGTEQFSAFGQAKKVFAELTLHPLLDHVSQVLSQTVGPDRRLQLLPRVTTTDRLERSREVQRLLDCGAITVNEARTEYLALPPVGGGDIFVPRNRDGGQEDNKGGTGEGRSTPNNAEDQQQ